jgi:phosphoenolpyruvate carboxykinase (ATP)
MVDLAYLGITGAAPIRHNLSIPALFERAIERGEGLVAEHGPLVMHTGQYTGRSVRDKFLVSEPSSHDALWWGQVNRPFAVDDFERLKRRLFSYLEGREVFVQDLYAGADPRYRLPVRIITEKAWQSMFARIMFGRDFEGGLPPIFEPGLTIVGVPGFQAVPERDNTPSEAFILTHFGERLVIIGGTSYAGEIKKSVFTALNYLLPQQGVLSMHCSANTGPQGDTAIFFGLSGTGKTTLSAEAGRSLIGDDEHGWTDQGVFNLEGGCYAKVINLDPQAEPEIYQTTQRFGTILENVVIDEATRRLDLDDASITENTRGAYPVAYLPNVVRNGLGGHPANIVMLTADAFGVLPPIARLNPAQAMYHFISGYTARVAGTERGVTEPEPTFSACFGAPFVPLHPAVYAGLLGDRLRKHGSRVWLINTGWSGGPHGEGQRMSIAYSRAVIRAALSGSLDGVGYRIDPVFGFEVPIECPGVPSAILDPRSTWSDPAAYDTCAVELARRFAANFEKLAPGASADTIAAGPKTD